MRAGLVAIAGALALAAALPGVAAAESGSCEVEVAAGSDLTPGGPASTDQNFSCAIRIDCPLAEVSCFPWGAFYADVSGFGQVGMRVEETASGDRTECVGVSHCSADAGLQRATISGGDTKWVVCTLQYFAAVQIHMKCEFDTTF
jgi:hypothetical protein